MLISVSGSTMQMAAILWHVSLLAPEGQKGLALGLVGLVRITPIIVFSMISGVVADAFDRRKLMLLSQSGRALISIALAVITLRGLDVIWPIYLLTAIGAVFRSFDAPARQSLIPNLVSREDLPNAISLNTIMFQTGSVVGPALAGITIASLGLGWVYAIDAVSFVAVIVSLLSMRNVPTRDVSERRDISLNAALEGLRFVFSAPLIRSSMLLDFLATFFSSATALLPIFAQDILSVGVEGYGWLVAAPAVGAMLTGMVMINITDRIDKRGLTLLWAVVAYGLATIAFGVSRSFWLTFLCLAMTGAADTVSVVMRNIIRHMNTPDRLRGRMTSVNMIFFMGGPQLGELEAGLAATWLGAPFAVVSGGIACIAMTALVAIKTPALRAYRRRTSVSTEQSVAAQGVSK